MKPAKRQQQPAAVQGSWSHLSIPLLFTTRFSRSLCSKTEIRAARRCLQCCSHHTPSIPRIFFHVFIPAPLSLPTYPLPWHRLALKPSPVDYESTKTTRTRQYRYSRRGCYLAEHSPGLRENLKPLLKCDNSAYRYYTNSPSQPQTQSPQSRPLEKDGRSNLDSSPDSPPGLGTPAHPITPSNGLHHPQMRPDNQREPHERQ